MTSSSSMQPYAPPQSPERWLQKLDPHNAAGVNAISPRVSKNHFQHSPPPSAHDIHENDTTGSKEDGTCCYDVQKVLHQAPNNSPELFPAAPSNPRAHLRRTATASPPHQLHIRRSRRDIKIYEQFCSPFHTFNRLPLQCSPMMHASQP
ncbi:hypothetical protein CAPTEDRAFT_213085 [Capitella teleta]|uniref:Uncharacterized protein n=1 Tax=Capitella teleta TaxID=283909 RepID=R7VHR1_CAPTE|nr:hypothetical protein CAPTEDRAFT_213085 [Capitella teleta]|eukprot:ELU18383.1 hypothetical protein CAPTEDRAFT_213085 [Capitella teleta]